MSAQTIAVGVCEDDNVLRGVLERALEQAGLRPVVTQTGADALARFSANPPDVLVLDVALPDADGRDVCRLLRERGVTSRVLFVSGSDDPADQRSAFAAGGDDYLVKPFALAQLLVRVGRLMSLTGNAPTTVPALVEGETARIDASTRAIVTPTGRVDLTPTEFRLLSVLIERRGHIVPRVDLAAAGWPTGGAVSDNTLDAYLARIRRKLRESGATDALRTRRGIGYELR